MSNCCELMRFLACMTAKSARSLSAVWVVLRGVEENVATDLETGFGRLKALLDGWGDVCKVL